MKREKLDLSEKLLEKNKIKLKYNHILEDLFSIGDNYRLPKENSICLESLFLDNEYGLRLSNIHDSIWLRIIEQAKKENQPLPVHIKNLDNLENECILLEDKFKKKEEAYNEKFDFLLKERWFQKFKKINNILEKSINNYEKILHEEFKSKSKKNAHIIQALEINIIKEIESIKNKYPEIPAVVWSSIIKKREYPLDEGSSYFINGFESYSKATDIVSKKRKKTYPKICKDYSKYQDLLVKTRHWIDKLYTNSFGLDHNEEIYRIMKDFENDQWHGNFEEILKPLSEIELKKSIIDADISLIENHRETFPGYGYVENTPRPLTYGYYDYDKEAHITNELAIMQVGIVFKYYNYFENKEFDIWWLWPNEHANRITLLKQIHHIIEKSRTHTFKKRWQQVFEKSLLRAGLIDKIFTYFQDDDSHFNNEELLELEKIFVTSKPFLNLHYSTFGYLYFKRSLDKTKRIKYDYYNIKGISLELLKYHYDNNKKTIYSFFLNDNDHDKYGDRCLSYQIDNFQDFLSILKILDQTLRNEGFWKIDEMFNKETLDLIYQPGGKNVENTVFEGINNFFLKFETFDFDTDSALDQITEYPTTKGTNWNQYVEEYKLALEGKTQDEIAIKYEITQQAISNHRQKLKGELARITGEAYEKWLEDKYKNEPDVSKVLRKGGKGEADLIIFKENDSIEVINAKAYMFSLSRPTFTIPAKEYQPEIKEARELEKKKKDVIVYVDFFNLYNKERYPRIVIDHNKPPERITIRFEDYLK